MRLTEAFGSTLKGLATQITGQPALFAGGRPGATQTPDRSGRDPEHAGQPETPARACHTPGGRRSVMGLSWYSVASSAIHASPRPADAYLGPRPGPGTDTQSDRPYGHQKANWGATFTRRGSITAVPTEQEPLPRPGCPPVGRGAEQQAQGAAEARRKPSRL